jgi:hypothetical protein
VNFYATLIPAMTICAKNSAEVTSTYELHSLLGCGDGSGSTTGCAERHAAKSLPAAAECLLRAGGGNLLWPGCRLSA